MRAHMPGFLSVREAGIMNRMRASIRGRDELIVRVQEALALATKKEAEHVVNVVIGGLEATLLNKRTASL